jgi:hypothetical protein
MLYHCVWGFDQERDITTNPEWERLYQYEIPVLAKVLPDGTEVYLSICSLLPAVNVYVYILLLFLASCW